MTQKKTLLTTDITGVRDRVSEAEWQERVNLAACYHLVAHFGWTDLIFTHISARAPDEEGVFLLNPFGFLFDEITASSLIKVDIDGNPVDDHGFEMHRAGFVIHSAIHAGRPEDAHCVIHTHSAAGVAVAAQKNGLLPISQHAQLSYNRVGYHGYEGEHLRSIAMVARSPRFLMSSSVLSKANRTQMRLMIVPLVSMAS